MKVVLELQDQPSNVRRITVRHDIVIGRGSDCNLRLSAPQVSRRHCFLRVGRDSISVTDLDSSNGTYIDGARITAGKRYDISNGTQLALGPIQFIVHVRAEAFVADSAKSKMAAGAASESLRAEAGRDSVARHAMADDGSTDGGRLRETESDAKMDYAVEQGGESAEHYEPTADYPDNKFLASGSADWFSPEADPMDSRLEIVDFGRRLSEQSQGADEAGALTGSDAFSESELIDEEPHWESAIIDSSESSDDLDVLSIADDSSVSSRVDDKLSSDAELLIADMNVAELEEVSEETPEVARILEEDWESSWVADDGTDAADDVIYEVESPDAVKNAGDNDKIDPDLQNFLKGF